MRRWTSTFHRLLPGLLLVVAALLTGALFAGDRAEDRSSPPAGATATADTVMARVAGVPILQTEVEQRAAHQMEVLRQLIDAELTRPGLPAGDPRPPAQLR